MLAGLKLSGGAGVSVVVCWVVGVVGGCWGLVGWLVGLGGVVDVCGCWWTCELLVGGGWCCAGLRGVLVLGVGGWWLVWVVGVWCGVRVCGGWRCGGEGVIGGVVSRWVVGG